jgi:integral membrane protein (TIGR01906 family)
LKIIKTITSMLFIFGISLMLVTSTIQLEINSVRLYEYGFEKYKVSEDTGIDKQQLSMVVRVLIDYFNYRIETPQLTIKGRSGEKFLLYQEGGMNYELTHLADVRRLFQLNHLVLLASVAYLCIYVLFFLLWRKGNWWDLVRKVKHGCILTLFIIIFIGVATALIDFEQIFLQFHHLAFSNPWWVSTGYLPRLFPLFFWEDVALICAAGTALGALLLCAVAWVVPIIYFKKRSQTY